LPRNVTIHTMLDMDPAEIALETRTPRTPMVVVAFSAAETSSAVANAETGGDTAPAKVKENDPKRATGLEEVSSTRWTSAALPTCERVKPTELPVRQAAGIPCRPAPEGRLKKDTFRGARGPMYAGQTMRQDVGEFKESPPASNVTEKSEEGMDVARESAAATAAGLESGVSGGAAARLLALAFTEKDAKPGGQSGGR